MRIGDLSARTGVSVRSLRYYEEQGLLAAERLPSGHRRYGDAAAERVELIQTLFAAGLSSRVLAELVADIDARVSTPESRARLHSERDRLRIQLAGLTRALTRLDEVIAVTDDPGSGCSYRA